MTPIFSTATPSHNVPSFILQYQRPAFEKLVRLGRAVNTANSQPIPIKQRSNTLVLGPSGSGKSHLVQAVANHFEANCLILSALEWIPLGSSGRGGGITWKHIAQFLLRIGRPTKPAESSSFGVIFIDEVDKLSGGSDWAGYLRTECFSLLDKRLPLGLQDEDDDTYSSKMRESMQETLRDRTLIIAAGAFQDLWEQRSRPNLGFHENVATDSDPKPDQLVTTLPRELVNRFRADLVILPEPTESDYQDMLLRSAEVFPAEMQNRFIALGETRVAKAIECRSGFRFVEELLIDFLIEWEESRPKLEWKEVKTEVPNLRLQLCERLVDRHFENLAKATEK